MSGETRKLQKVGGGTYTVSVPKEWATEQSLSAGDTVQLYPDGDGSLLVCRDGTRNGPAAATIQVDDCEGEALDRTVRAAYAAGIERLTLSTEASEEFDDEQRRRIDRLVRSYTGMRIVEEGDGAVTIQTILDDGEVSVQRTVVQLQFITLSLFRTSVDLVLDPTTNGQDRIENRRVDAQRLASLVTRQFSRSLSRPATAVGLGIDRPTAFDCYRTAAVLDGLANRSAEMGQMRSVQEADVAVVETLRSVAEGVRLYVEEATSAVVDGVSLDAVQELRETRAGLATVIADAETTLEGNRATHRTLRQFEICVDCGDRIADIALQAAIRREN